MTNERFEYLFTRYLEGTISKDIELPELMQFLASSENEEAIIAMIEAKGIRSDEYHALSQEAGSRILRTIRNEYPTDRFPIKRQKRYFLKIAAAVVLLVGLWGIGHVFKKEPVGEHIVSDPIIRPGSRKAFLTLGDGTSISLNEQDSSALSDNIQLKKEDGFLVYTNTRLETSTHQLTTPRGAEYKIRLPDGSKVWLNAASSIKYSANFLEAGRVVELTGEAFFDVKRKVGKGMKDKLPFIVKLSGAYGEGTTVDVLGTTFNVTAYENQQIKVTLKKGVVHVNKGVEKKVLKPGEQAIVHKGLPIHLTMVNDVEDVISWKEGLFYFENETIENIMNEISRWYDVDIVYASEIPNKRFDGKISRYAELADVLKILELSGINFLVKGKIIYVE